MYTLRRDRSPPVRFKKWYEFAKKSKCNLDESIYDNIYEDLSPFFGMAPKEFNHRLDLVSQFQHDGLKLIKIENGRNYDQDNPQDYLKRFPPRNPGEEFYNNHLTNNVINLFNCIYESRLRIFYQTCLHS